MKEQEIIWADMTIYHIPESLARRFKEFCRLHAKNKFGIGLELLLNSFNEKENYLFLTNEVMNLRIELDRLKEMVAEMQSSQDDIDSIKTMGGELSL